MRYTGTCAFAAAVVASTAVSTAHAQRAAPAASAYPAKPIRIIAPFAPGVPNDMLARIVGQKLTAAWSQQVLVDSRPGGGTVVGTDVAAKAPPDGHTRLMVSLATAVNVKARSRWAIRPRASRLTSGRRSRSGAK